MLILIAVFQDQYWNSFQFFYLLVGSDQNVHPIISEGSLTLKFQWLPEINHFRMYTVEEILDKKID